MSRFKGLDRVRDMAMRARRGGLEPLTGGIDPQPGGAGATARQLLRRLKAAEDPSADLLAQRDYAGVVRRLGGRDSLEPAESNNLGIAYAHLALSQRSTADWRKAEAALSESKHEHAGENLILVRQARRRAA